MYVLEGLTVKAQVSRSGEPLHRSLNRAYTLCINLHQVWQYMEVILKRKIWLHIKVAYVC